MFEKESRALAMSFFNLRHGGKKSRQFTENNIHNS